MTDHHLSPEHERVARQATERIRAAIAAGLRQPTGPDGDPGAERAVEASVTERSSSISARS